MVMRLMTTIKTTTSYTGMKSLMKKWSTNLSLNYTKGAGYFEQYKKEESSAKFKSIINEGSDLVVRRWLDNDFLCTKF